MGRLTKAQLECLATLSEAFRNDGWMFAPGASKATLSVLRIAGFVEGDYDGGRFVRHRITSAGLQALQQAKESP